MDRSRAAEFLGQHLKPLTSFLCLGHWTFTVCCKPLPDGVRATIDINETYEFAEIAFDADKSSTDEELLDTLYHELTHVILSPAEVYFKFASPHFPAGSPFAESERVVRTHAVEQIVINLERVWRNGLRDFYLDLFTSGGLG